MNILGLILGIAALITLVCIGVNPIASSLLAALLVGTTNGFGVWESLNEYYIPGFMNFASQMFFVFLLATVYGKLISVTGSAHKLAYSLIKAFGKKDVLLIIGVATGVLVYCGVSAFVVVFTILPIGYILIKEANVPKILLPATITWGQATFFMSAMPGSPQTSNIIPTLYLGTSPTAGPMLGIIAALVMFILGHAYLKWQAACYRVKGIGFDINSKINLNVDETATKENCPNFFKAIAPMVLMLALYLLLANGILGIKMSAVIAVNTAMFSAIVLIFTLHPKKIKIMLQAFSDGTKEWIMPLFNVACMIAFGVVVQKTSGFELVSSWLLSLPISVYFSAFVTTSVTCGITGSASGGETIALTAMADKWLSLGANPEVLHRIVSITSSGLDSLPHCGGVTIVYNMCDESIGSGYKHCFVTTSLVPLIAAVIVVMLANLGIV